MRARAPASSANLGPGFDTLAIALELYVDVEVRPAPRLIVRAEGEGADLPTDASNLAAQVAMEVVGHDRLAVTIRSQIPVGRGLGSSAAVVAAAAAAAGSNNPLAVATARDGHPENAAASVVGGLITATTVVRTAMVTRLPLDPGLVYVVLVPDRGLPTSQARQLLPPRVAHADAAFNLGRMGLLLGGLADRRRLVKAATEDRIHQAARSPLFPEASQLMAGLLRGGARATCVSGAGPAVLGICDIESGRKVRDAGEEVLDEAGVHGRALLLKADTRGLIVGSP